MSTRDQALALMRQLGLTPDAAETAKQQTAIECSLDEAVHRQRIKGGCPACNRQLLFIGAGGRITCSNAQCPEPAAADDFLNAALYPDDVEKVELMQAKTGVVKFPGLEKKYADAKKALQYIDLRVADALVEVEDGGNVLLNALRDIRGEVADSVERRTKMDEGGAHIELKDDDAPPRNVAEAEAAGVLRKPQPDGYVWGTGHDAGEGDDGDAHEDGFHYGAIKMGRRWFATRYVPNSGLVEYWEAGDWNVYSIANYQERQKAAFGPGPWPDIKMPTKEEAIDAGRKFLKLAGDTETLTMIALALNNQNVVDTDDVDPERGVELLIEKLYAWRELPDQLEEAQRERDLAQTDYGHLYRDHERLQSDARVLIHHLSGSDGMQPAWWLVAAGAVNRIDAVVNPDQTAAVMEKSDDDGGRS